MLEFELLVKTFEAGLRRSLDDINAPQQPAALRHEACRLAISDLSTRYRRDHIHTSLLAAECEGKRLEAQLQRLSLQTVDEHPNSDNPSCDNDDDGGDGANTGADDDAVLHDDLRGLHHGHFRLFSTELFDLLGQPTELRLGTLRFYRHTAPGDAATPPWVTVELALNESFYIADSVETLPFHTFRLPPAPSLQNRGILSRKPQDDGAFPAFDSWLLFTFLGNGCIKVEVPIEMCADVYGDRLRGRADHEVLFWGFFIPDDTE